MKSLFRLLIVIAVMGSASCGRRESTTPGDEASRRREMDKFVEAIRIVQDRYVDVERVELERIISNSLKGMVTAVDPYAQIYYTGMPHEVDVPEDVALIEATGPDDSDILSLRIFGFNGVLKKQLRRLESPMREINPSAILLDCRGAHGEDFEAAAAVAEWFLEPGLTIGSLITGQEQREVNMISQKTPLWPTNLLVVLTDHTLSGPGEFLAAALRAHQRCILVGQPTRGVAVMQTPVRLTDEWTVQLTTGRAREPGGRDITGNPIVPDIIAEPEPGNMENVDWVRIRGQAVLSSHLTFQETPE